ncbi:MAG: hypothetical protein AAB467_03210 [Patescibacteria group bacterium]
MGIFRSAEGNRLLDTLGLKYGFVGISEDGAGKMTCVITLEDAKQELERMLAAKLITPVDLSALYDAAMKHGLPPTLSDIIPTLRQFRLPEDYVPGLSFKLCNCKPEPHGWIGTSGGYRYGEVRTLEDGFGVCYDLSGYNFAPLDLVSILKQMLNSDLPVNVEEWRKRCATLSKSQKPTAKEFVN